MLNKVDYITLLVFFFLKSRALQNGTTTASYFATIHLEATLELCNIIGMYTWYMLLYELLYGDGGDWCGGHTELQC